MKHEKLSTFWYFMKKHRVYSFQGYQVSPCIKHVSDAIQWSCIATPLWAVQCAHCLQHLRSNQDRGSWPFWGPASQGSLTSKLEYRRFPSYLLCILLIFPFHLLPPRCTLNWIFLLFHPRLPCHFYLVVITATTNLSSNRGIGEREIADAYTWDSLKPYRVKPSEAGGGSLYLYPYMG